MIKGIKWFFAGTALLLSNFGQAQEVERYLDVNPTLIENAEKESQFQARQQRGGGSMSLPFFDDFSRYSLPTDNPDIPVEWQRWEDDNVFINSNFPIQPPTVGVATFDGLKSNGYPYDFVSADAYGTADTLTSVPLNLAGLDSLDNVYLSFFYQGGGLGNKPDEQDSLVVEFWNNSGGGGWIRRWSIPGGTLPAEFQRVFIPIQDAEFGNTYFLDGFKFRFINYSTLSGSVDHWHIDYVELAANVDPENAPIQDLAFMEEENTLLRDFTAMPWTHFLENPALYLEDTTRAAQRNLSETAVNFQSGYRIDYEDQSWDHPNDYSITNGVDIINPQSYFPIGNDVFDTNVNDTCAIFSVNYYHETSDIVTSNDTISFEQNFTNYYAYDDGTAERAYGLTTGGGKIAMKYQLAKEDTLLGLFVHWIPFVDDQSTESFILRAWDDNGGVPGEELATIFTFNYPKYYDHGYNKYAYYEYDDPIGVDGTIYVGWVQQGDNSLNVGNDKNTNQNPGRLFYQLGIGASWQASSITGSLMIRPVFKSGKSFVWNSVEEDLAAQVGIYPNPTSDNVNIEVPTGLGSYSLSVYNQSGKLIMTRGDLQGLQQISIQDLAQGVYILEVRTEDGRVIHERLMKL